MSGIQTSATSLKADRRLQTLEAVMQKHGYHRDALLEILQTAQDLYSYIDKDLLIYISTALNVPPSHVYGVVTFYHLFKLKQPGAHVVTFCLGTACYVKGVEQIISAVEKEFMVTRGKTSSDGKLSLFITRCIGACAMAPNLIVDEGVIGKATPEVAIRRIKAALEGEKPEA